MKGSELNMKVIKFGGSSLANGQQFERVVNIIREDSQRQVVVTSAPGKSATESVKVTDMLLQYAESCISGHPDEQLLEAIKSRYRQIADSFDVSEADLATITDQLDALNQAHYPSYRQLREYFAAHGELLNAQLLALILQSQGVPARFVLPTQIRFESKKNDEAVFDEEKSLDRLATFPVEKDVVYVFPGFFGFDQHNRIRTFSRGGSDITGAILAEGLQASLYENFTDVSAIATVDPNVIANPEPIQAMSYSEMRELSYAGFNVFHDEAIIPAIHGQVPICVKNTNDPDALGTWIGPASQLKDSRNITGIACTKHFAALYLHRYLLNRDSQFTRRLLALMADYNISYDHMPSGIDDLTVIFNRENLSEKQLQEFVQAVRQELAPDIIRLHDQLAIIMVVGQGMKNRSGALEQIIAPLAKEKISLQMVNQGASEIAIMLAVDEEDAKRAIKAIYDSEFA